MKFGVVIFPGSNCDRDMIYALDKILDQEVVSLWHKDKDLKGVDCIVLPGGFSYGDYLRTGAVAKFSPIMQSVKEFANDGGFVLGICNGFQILCESGLLPGSLIKNINQKFICRNVYLKSYTRSLVSNFDDVIKIPIAHGEGRYYIEETGLHNLEINNQIIFKYCNESGISTEDSNPNGSVSNIAGICNLKRNVFGMMPHPERSSDSLLGNDDGLKIFNSILNNFHKQ